MPMNIAVAGSEELISENLLELLQERELSVGQLFLLTAQDAEDQESVRFHNQTVYVQDIASFDWSQAELVFWVGNTEEYTAAFEQALHSGCKMIDLRSAAFKASSYGLSLFAKQEDLESAVHVSPGDLTVLMAQIVQPFFEETAVSQLNVVALKPVSAYGKKGTEALAREIARLMNGRPLENTVFPAQLAFNLVPEQRNSCLASELQLLFPEEKINTAVTLLQAPVFYGTTIIADIVLEDALPKELITKMLSSLNNTELSDELLTPVTHGSNQNKVYMQFIADEQAEIQTFRLYIVTDLLRSGRVQNAVSLAERLVNPVMH